MRTKSHLLMTTALGAILVVWTGSTQAADLVIPKAAPALALPPPAWYIQVEGGVSVFDPHDANPGLIYNNICNHGRDRCTWASSLFGQAGPNVGIRLGYQFTPVLRADVSFQYMSFTLTGLHTEVGNLSDGFCSGSFALGCTLNATRSATALVGLVNGYIDLDPLWRYRFGRFHPYLTAGVGVAADHLGANCVSCDFGVGNGPNTTTQFAWAVGAGARVDLFSDLKFDVAYRFLDLGTFRGGFSPVADPAGNLTGGDTVHVSAHTVTFGLALLY